MGRPEDVKMSTEAQSVAKSPDKGGRAEIRYRAADILTLRKLKYFVAVAESGKVTAAARDILHVSPAVVTVALRELEDFFGVQLFERRGGGMQLTREGELFRGYCEKALSLVEDASSALRKKSPLRGRLRVTASPAVHGYFLPPLLSRFRRLFPAVRVELAEMDRAEIERALLEERADVGVLLISNLKNRNLRALALVSSSRTLWCAAHHRLAELPTVSLREIARESYIQLTIDEAEENTRRFWGEHQLSPRTLLRTETVEAVRGYVGHGEGVTILSEMLFRPWSLEGDRIVSKRVREPLPKMKVGLAWPRGPLSPVGRAFRDFMAFAAARPDEEI